ncbi:MAG: DUF192 domain-containing protein [Anaerolineaceae bacterium]
MKIVTIVDQNHPEIKIRATWCSSFFSKFKGLMLTKSIPDYSGIILVENSESRINTAIHMLFMNFDITAVWINARLEVVDLQLAKKWHLSYIPNKKAQYVLELNTNHLNDFHIGDQLLFEYEK